MRHPDHLVLDSDMAAIVVADAERAIPVGTTVMSAVEERLARAGGSHSSRGRRRPARRPALLVLAAAVLVAALAASPLVEATASPISGWLLRAVGLTPVQVTQVSRAGRPNGVVSATSAGYTVTLTGAYGDQFRTVLLLSANPKAFVMAPRVTDETGHVLGGGGGVAGLDGSALEFDPLPPGRHLLTVHVDVLMVQDGGAQPAVAHRGDWTLRFPLDAATAATVATVPASGDLGRVHVAIHGIVSSGGSLYVQVETMGATIDELQMQPPEGQGGPGGGPGALHFQVFDAEGHQITTTLSGGVAAGKGATDLRAVTWTLYAKESGIGAYRLVVTFEGQHFESQFTIR